MDSSRVRERLLALDGTQRVRLYLVRHGEAANVTDGVFRYNGHVDVDVSSKGTRQIEQIARHLEEKKISAVYSSDLRRARKGAEVIARYQGLEIRAFPEFREVKMGAWEGLTFDEIRRQYPQEVDRKFDEFVHYRVPGGENLLDVRERAIPKMRELIEMHRGCEIVLVGHGGMNTVLLCDAMNLDLENFFRITQSNGCINVVDYYEDTAVVRLMNGFVQEGVFPSGAV